MALAHSPKIATDGLVFYYDAGNPQKSWKGAPTFNSSLQDGQNDVNPWLGDGSPTPLGIEPNIRFRKRKVAKFITGTSGNCYINGTAKLSNGTNSTVWTSTFYLKRVDGTALSSVGMYLYVSNNSNVNQTVSVTEVEDGWYKAVYTRSGLVSGHPTLTGMFSLGAATEYYFADWQCENIGISTPWVPGTRSNTQAILDLTNNNTITAESLTYNNDGSFGFNGSNNYIDVGNSSVLSSIGGTNNITVSSWVYYNSFLGGGGRPYSVITVKGNPWTWLLENPSNTFQFRITAGGSDVNVADTTAHLLNTWYNVVGSYNGQIMKIYVNGKLKNTRSQTGTLGSNSITAKVGTFTPGDYAINGIIDNVSVYNKTLTDEEIDENFNALRGRYGI